MIIDAKLFVNKSSKQKSIRNDHKYTRIHKRKEKKKTRSTDAVLKFNYTLYYR